jgi:hypothetical protein
MKVSIRGMGVSRQSDFPYRQGSVTLADYSRGIRRNESVGHMGSPSSDSGRFEKPYALRVAVYFRFHSIRDDELRVSMAKIHSSY